MMKNLVKIKNPVKTSSKCNNKSLEYINILVLVTISYNLDQYNIDHHNIDHHNMIIILHISPDCCRQSGLYSYILKNKDN